MIALLLALVLAVPAQAQVDAGHVDLAPRFVESRWTLDLLVEDEWRAVEETALVVDDDARQTVPDDPQYDFLHGREVYVVPQTQDPDVVWLGWNTQDPEVMKTVDRGVTLTLKGVEGPGSLVVYLQSGDFGAPQPLWDSTAASEPIWVDVDTHTHANWAFSKSGAYLVRVEARADLVDGTTVTDTRELRFAVGSKTTARAALAARWRGTTARAETTAAAAAPPRETGGAAMIAALVGGAALLAAAGAVALRGRRAKRMARR